MEGAEGMALDWLEQLKKKAEAGQSSILLNASIPARLDPVKRYQRVFRIAYDFLSRLSAEDGERNWNSIWDAMESETLNNENDPLLIDLLIAVYLELERQVGQQATGKTGIGSD